MSLKSEIKMSVLHDQGIKADDRLESAQKRQAGHDGAKQVLRVLAKNIASLSGSVDNDVSDNKLPLDEPAKVSSYVKLMIDRAVNMTLSAAQHQENLQLSVGGEIAAYKSMVDGLKKEIDVEKAKIMALQNAIENNAADDGQQLDPRSSRPVGVRPTGGIAAQRKAEDATSANNAPDAPTSSISDDAQTSSISDDAPMADEKKKRGRRKVG